MTQIEILQQHILALEQLILIKDRIISALDAQHAYSRSLQAQPGQLGLGQSSYQRNANQNSQVTCASVGGSCV